MNSLRKSVIFRDSAVCVYIGIVFRRFMYLVTVEWLPFNMIAFKTKIASDILSSFCSWFIYHARTRTVMRKLLNYRTFMYTDDFHQCGLFVRQSLAFYSLIMNVLLLLLLLLYYLGIHLCCQSILKKKKTRKQSSIL